MVHISLLLQISQKRVLTWGNICVKLRSSSSLCIHLKYTVMYNLRNSILLFESV